MAGACRGRDLGVLVELCRELDKLGLNVGLSDARPALSVRGGLTDRRVWIELDSAGESYVWKREDRDGHSVEDPTGAAERIAEYLKARDAGPGDRS